jgi:hypothetical protein
MLQNKFIQAVGTGLQETDTIAGRVMLNKTKGGKKIGLSKSLNTIKNDFDVKNRAGIPRSCSERTDRGTLAEASRGKASHAYITARVGWRKLGKRRAAAL